MDDYAKRKRLLTIGGIVFSIVVILIVIIAIILNNRDSNPYVNSFEPEQIYYKDSGFVTPYGITASARDSSFLVATNRNLTEYDPFSGEAKALMNDGALPVIEDLSWSPDKKYALFNGSRQATSEGTPATILDEQYANTDKSIWWIADFTSKKYTPLGSEISSLGWVDANTFYVVGQPTTTSAWGIYTSKVGSGTYQQIALDSQILFAESSSEGFLAYKEKDGIGSLFKVVDGKLVAFLNTLSRFPLFNGDGSLLVAEINTETPITDDIDPTEETMKLIDTKTGHIIKVLAEKQKTDGYMSSDGKAFYFFETTTGDFLKLTLAGEKSTLQRVKITPDLPEEPTNIIANSKGTLLFLDTKNKLYVGSTDKTKSIFQAKKDAVSTTDGLIGKDFEVYYYPDSEVYGMSLTGDIAQAKELAFSAMRRAGTRPEMLNIIYEHEVTSTAPAEELVDPNNDFSEFD